MIYNTDNYNTKKRVYQYLLACRQHIFNFIPRR
jgi:hypothetical protein